MTEVTLYSQARAATCATTRGRCCSRLREELAFRLVERDIEEEEALLGRISSGFR